MNALEIRQLRYFLAVLEHGTMQAAARALFVAQPSISQAIATLERELGVPLFRRVGRRLVLTPAGEEFAAAARRAVRHLDAARAVVEDVRPTATGRLDLVTMPSPGVEPLTTLLAQFHRHVPQVRMSVRAAFTADDVLIEIRSGRAELGLLGSDGPLSAADVDVIALDRQELLFIERGPAGGEAAPQRPITADRLGDVELIVSHRGTVMRSLVDGIVAANTGVRIAAEVEHRTSILPMVLAGIGATVLPEAWAAQAVSAGAVVRRIAPPVFLHNHLVAYRRALTPAGERFFRLAEDYDVSAAGGGPGYHSSGSGNTNPSGK